MVVRELLTLLGFKSDDKPAKKYDKVLKKIIRTTKWAALGAVAMGTAFLKGAGDIEQTSIAFETMLGSASEADKLLKDITSFAARTPFKLTGLIQSSKQLLAYGFAAEDIIPTMTNLGNIAAGVGKDKLPSIILAFGKIKTKGKASMEELNIMLEAGVPILDELAKGFGVSKQELTKMVSKGVVGFDDVNKALTAMGGEGGRFGGLMVKQSKSFLGIISNIGDFITNLINDVGKDLLPGASKLAKTFLNFMEANRPLIKGTLSKAFKNIGKLIVIIFTILSRGFKKLSRFFPQIKAIAKASLGSILDLVNGIFSLFKGDSNTAKEYFKKAFDGAKNIVAQAWTTISIIFDKFWQSFKKKNPKMAAALERVWEKVKNTFKSAFETVDELFQGIFAFFTGDTDEAVEHFVNAIKNIPKMIKDALDTVLQMVEEIFPALKPLVDALQWILDSLEKLFSTKTSQEKLTDAVGAGANIIKQLQSTPGGVEQLVKGGYISEKQGKNVMSGKLDAWSMPDIIKGVSTFLKEGNKFDINNQNTYQITVPAGTPKEVVENMAKQINEKMDEQWNAIMRQAREQIGIEPEKSDSRSYY